MQTLICPEINRAVADAVRLVNAHAGRACVRLRYADEPAEMDFVANSAKLNGGEFVFMCGFESYSGRVEDLADISAELIDACR